MSYGGWNSMRDVKKDLWRVGQHGLEHALDEGHVLVGEQPPPAVYMPDDDEEAELQLRTLCGGQLPSTHDRVIEPDVAGISKYLRMIDGPDDEPPRELEIKEEPQKEQTKKEVVVISKLNPNCKEFVPRFDVTDKADAIKKEAPNKTDECVPMFLNNECIDKRKITGNKADAKEKEASKKADKCVPMILNNECMNTNKIAENKAAAKEKESSKKTDECVPMIMNNDGIHTSKIAVKEKVALEKKIKDKDLRKKIIDSSNTVCPKTTKERNVAIVSLLKLHSQDPFCNTTNGTTGKRKEVFPNVKGDCNVAAVTHPILKTPAYYEKCPGELTPPKCFKAKPVSTTSPALIEKQPNDENGLSADVIESVNKVQKWLQGTTDSNNSDSSQDKISEQKTNVDEKQNDATKEDRKLTTPRKQKIHSGPFTFKRKSKPASPSCTLNSDSSDNQKPKKEKCDEYKPSKHAEELARKYTEHNNNMKAEQENILTWKILTELKAKEERIARETAQAEAQSQPQEQMDETTNTCVAS